MYDKITESRVMYSTHNSKRGSTLIYAMIIIALFLIAYAVYFFATLKPADPYQLKSEYEQLYTGDQNDINQSDFAYGQDLYGQFGNRVEQTGINNSGAGNDARNDVSNDTNGTVSKYIGEPVPVQISDSEAQASVDLGTSNPQNQTEDNVVTPKNENSNTPISSEAIVLDDVYTSKINPRITFPIPAGTKVKEVGVNGNEAGDPSITKSGQLFTFSIKDKDVTLSTEKVASGCFNPLISFAIPSGLGIDYRILYTQKEVTLSNTYQAIIGTEEYGTYKGMAGYRGTSCVQSAVPTKIDMRSAGWKKTEQKEALKLIEELLAKMSV